MPAGKARITKKLAWRSVAGFFDLVGQAIAEEFDPLGKLLVKWIKTRAPEGATGDYKDGVKYRLVGRGIHTRLELYDEAEHEEYVEKGRGPGRLPPIKNLVAWVARVLHVADFSQQRRIAWAIAVSMTKEDYKREGLHLFEEAEIANRREVEATLKRAEQRVVKVLNAA
jgi:hypothetical protein